MPAQKRKLSVSEAPSTSASVEKRQRYSTSLLFKPNIGGPTRLKKDNDVKSGNLDSNSADDCDQNAPRLPKLSIKRTVNRDSNMSEFTIETKNGDEEEEEEGSMDEDEGSYSSEDENENVEVELEGEEENEDDEEEEIDDDDQEEANDENEYSEEEDEEEEEPLQQQSPKPAIKLKLKKFKDNEDNAARNANFVSQMKRGRPRLKQQADEVADESIKAKRGRKPGYRKYPEGYIKPQKTKGPRAITSYFLFCQVNRPKVAEQNPDLKLRAQQRIVSDMWNKLTDKERLIWRQKAVKMSKKGSKGMISTGVLHQPSTTVKRVGRKPLAAGSALKLSTVAEPKVESKVVTVVEKEPEDTTNSVPYPPNLVNFVEDCKPIDLAAYLTILGESMTTFGNNILKLQEGNVAVQGASFVLLDAFLCALAPIFCLTTQVEELNGCPRETIMNILDNISVLMPGP